MNGREPLYAPPNARGRILTTVRCRARRHVLARLIIREDDGHRVVVVPRWATADVDPKGRAPYVLRGNHGGGIVDLDDENTGPGSRRVACACGSDFLLYPEQLLGSPLRMVHNGVLYLPEDAPEGATRAPGTGEGPPAQVILDPADTPRTRRTR